MDEELTTLAKNLKGIRICHVNSTAAGGSGGLLARYIPMLQALGVQADWRLIHGEPDFFAITKAFHNALQGGRYGLGKAEQDRYLKVNERSAKALGNDYDLYIVHDPQRRPFDISRARAASNGCGVVTSTVRHRTKIQPFVASLLGRVRGGRVHDGPIRAAATGVQVHRAAIDPLATKNMELPPICAAASLRIPVWIRPGRCFCKSLALILGRIRSAWCMPIAWSKRTFPQCNSCSSAPWPGTTRKVGDSGSGGRGSRERS